RTVGLHRDSPEENRVTPVSGPRFSGDIFEGGSILKAHALWPIGWDDLGLLFCRIENCLSTTMRKDQNRRQTLSVSAGPQSPDEDVRCSGCFQFQVNFLEGRHRVERQP